MATVATVERTDLPIPCAECLGLVERAAGAMPWQWEEVVAPHPYAQPDDTRAAFFLRCAQCGCCWYIHMDVWEVAPVYAEQLHEAEYRHRLGAIRYGLPQLEGRWGAAVLYGPLFLVYSGLALLAAWYCSRAAGGWGEGWPVPVLFSAAALGFGWALVRAVRNAYAAVGR